MVTAISCSIYRTAKGACHDRDRRPPPIDRDRTRQDRTAPGENADQSAAGSAATLEATDIGSIINNKQFTKVCGYVEDGLKRKDARLVFGGLPA
jgi:hypothetical protein